MKLPFTTEQFLQVFETYNTAVFPLSFIFPFLGILSFFFLWTGQRFRNRWIPYVLAFFWAWMGIVYHLVFFSSINKAAYIFGPAFLLQGFLFYYHGVIRNKLHFARAGNWSDAAGTLLILYALVAYPITSNLAGHDYPKAPVFGVPCPTTIFTLGILSFFKGRLPATLWIIPVLWSFLGLSAARQLDMTEDYALPAATLVFLVLWAKKRQLNPIAHRAGSRRTSA